MNLVGLNDFIYLVKQWSEIHKRENIRYGTNVRPSWIEFAAILIAYSNPARHYHTLVHLVQMLRFIDKFDLIADLHMIKLAAFYHDVVYVVGAKDNEEESGNRLFSYATKIGFSYYTSPVGADLVDATAKHTAPYIGERADLWPIMHDADLFIFAQDWDTYRKYATNIWQEYRAVAPRYDYIAGRKTFLTNVLKTKIFKTSLAAGEYEERAKANVSRELELLQSFPQIIMGL